MTGWSSRAVWLCLCLACTACGADATKIIVHALPISNWKTAAKHLPKRVVQANFDFALASKAAIQEGIALPKPASVRLSDLSPSLRELEGKAGADFLRGARDEQGKPIDFSYARFNEVRMDTLLREAARAKALSYQTLQTLNKMVALSSRLLDEEVARTPTLYRAIERAALRKGLSAQEREEVRTLQKLGRELGVLVPSYAVASRNLVEAGKQLITDAPSLLNANLMLHLSTVTTSLNSAVNAIAAAGSWTADVAIVLRGFARGSKRGEGAVDFDEDRLDRQELAEMLFQP